MENLVTLDLKSWKPKRENLPYWAKWIAKNSIGDYEVFEKKPKLKLDSDWWHTGGKSQVQRGYFPVKVANWQETLQTIDQFYKTNQ